MTGKRPRVKGYTVLECLLVLWVLGVMLLIAVPIQKRQAQTVNLQTEINRIVMRQYEAVIESKPRVYSDHDQDIEIIFNRKGNVRQANTYRLYGHKIIVALGCGRIYVKK